MYSLQYSFDGKFLAIGCGNGTIRVSSSLADILLTVAERYEGQFHVDALFLSLNHPPQMSF